MIPPTMKTGPFIRRFISLSILLLCSSAVAQPIFLRIGKVDVANNTVTIRCHSSVTINVEDHYLCHSGVKTQFADMTIVDGSYNIPSNDSATFSLSLSTSGDLSYYTSNVPCTASSSLQHYVQWGSAGNVGEVGAVAASKWDAGDFLPIADRYCYHSGTLVTGAADWSIPIGIDETEPVVEFTIINDAVNAMLTIHIDRFSNALHLQLIDVSGEVVNTAIIDQARSNLDLSGLATGLYVVRIQDEKGRVGIRRVVIQ